MPVVGVYLRGKSLAHIHQETYTKMFIAPLLLIDKRKKEREWERGNPNVQQ